MTKGDRGSSVSVWRGGFRLQAVEEGANNASFVTRQRVFAHMSVTVQTGFSPRFAPRRCPPGDKWRVGLLGECVERRFQASGGGGGRA